MDELPTTADEGTRGPVNPSYQSKNLASLYDMQGKKGDIVEDLRKTVGELTTKNKDL